MHIQVGLSERLIRICLSLTNSSATASGEDKSGMKNASQITVMNHN
jgi:hypothetical protein